jgi:hypothetical protein
MPFLIELALKRFLWPNWAAKLFGFLAPILLVSLGLCLAYAFIHHSGEKAGAAKVRAGVEAQHTATVAEARTDEQHAQVVTDRIADRTVRADTATDTIVRSTIEDLRNELAAQKAAPVGAPPPAAPVASMSASLNGLIDRANRAAETADPVP